MKGYILFLMILCANSYAEDAKKLTQIHKCVGCHAVDRKFLGPSWSQIAAKYKDSSNYQSILLNKIKNGGSGVWGPTPMFPIKTATDEEINTMVNWIVTGVQPTSDQLPTTAEVNAAVAKQKAQIDKEMEGIRNANKELESAKRNYENSIQNSSNRQINTRTAQQNNSPDIANTQSNSNSNSEIVDGVNQCIKVTYSNSGNGKFQNICSFRVNLYWCVDYECKTNNGRLIALNPGSSHPAMSDKQAFSFAACQDPYGVDHRSEGGGFDGNFTCKR